MTNEDLARAHVRELHAKMSLVMGVQPLSTVPSLFACKQSYDEAGVQAYFEWRAEGQTGQPLAQ